jgi:outer membrane protein assembly factor BamB
MTDDFPLPVRWRTTLPWFCVVGAAPAVDGDRVVARCGEAVVAFDAETGEVGWRAPLGARAGEGTYFAAAGDRFVTDVVRRPERLSTLVGVRPDGAQAWRTDLPGRLTPGGAAVHADEVLALGREAGAGQFLYRVGVADGGLRGRHKLPWAATALLPYGAGLLVANGSDERAPGLYRTAPDGGAPEPVADEPVWRLERAGDVVLTLARPDPAGPRALRVHDADTLAVRWSAPARADVAALCGDTVLAVGAGGPHGELVARDAGTGAERWRAGLPGDVGRLAVAGPVVLCGHVAGNALYRLGDGAPLGETARSYGAPAVAGDRLYVGSQQAVLCAALPAR